MTRMDGQMSKGYTLDLIGPLLGKHVSKKFPSERIIRRFDENKKSVL